MKLLHSILFFCFSLYTLCINISCSSTKETKPHLDINRFEQLIYNYPSLSDTQKESFKKEYNDITTLLYQNANSNNLDSILLNIPQSAIYKAFSNDVNTKFKNLDTLSTSIAIICDNLSTLFPAFKLPKIKSYITPYNQSIILTHSTLLIGLNHYLGASHPMYEYYESYQRVNKIPARIPYNIAEALVRNCVDEPAKDKTLLDALIFEGLIAYITTEVIPKEINNNPFGYTIEQETWCKNHEKNIWIAIISQDMLYSKSGIIHDKMILPAPFTSLVSQESPGELGRWIGLQIIKSYVNHNHIDSIPQLCSEILKKEGQAILMESQYEG